MTEKSIDISFILLYFYTFILFRKFGQIWKKVFTFNMAFRQIHTDAAAITHCLHQMTITPKSKGLKQK